MEYHSEKFDDHSLMVYQNSKLIALLPANLKGNIIYTHQGLTYGGIILSPTIKFEKFLHIFKILLQYLNEKSIEFLQMKLLPSIYTLFPNDEINYVLFKLNADLYRRDLLSVIKLNTRLKISDNRMEGVKRGERNNLVIKEENQFSSFWNEILIPNLKSKHSASPVHSLDEIEYLKEHFPQNIRQFNVYLKDRLVAGTTIYESKFVAHAQYISGNSENNRLGSLDYLYNHLIENEFKDKRYLDFGTSNENMGHNVNRGLQFWKEGYGARSITQDFYNVETKNHTKLESVFV